MYNFGMAKPTLLDATQIRAAALQLLNARTDTIETLAARVNDERVAAAAHAETELHVARAYAAATKAGWTESELKLLGLDEPTRKLPGRPRRQRSTTAASTAPAVDQDVTEHQA